MKDEENITAIVAGEVVESRKGHDKNCRYVVVSLVSKDFCLIANGQNRTLDKPKLKRIKHVKRIPFFETLTEQVDNGKITNEEIKHLIKVSNEIKTNKTI